MLSNYLLINYTDCTEEQQKEIFFLRNLSDIRKWMVNQEPIKWENHLRFVESLRHTSDRKYYAIYKENDLVGTYNLTKESEHSWERGIITSPKYHGTGVTSEMERWVLNSLPKDEFKTITAKVKLDNIRSIKYHEKIGYKETYRSNEFIYYKLTL